MTLEEQENAAYLSGDIEKAALLRQLIEAESRIEELEDQIFE